MLEQNVEEKLEELIVAVNGLANPTFFDWITLLVSGVAVIISGLAIYYAIMVPKTLANQKNRITLFEKRYGFYLVLLDLHGVLHGIRELEDREKIENLTFALGKLKKQLGCDDNCKFYNDIVTVLNSPQYFFSCDITQPQYKAFQDGIMVVLKYMRGTEQGIERVEGIFENLDFFYETVKKFDSYFYICPPKKK